MHADQTECRQCRRLHCACKPASTIFRSSSTTAPHKSAFSPAARQLLAATDGFFNITALGYGKNPDRACGELPHHQFHATGIGHGLQRKDCTGMHLTLCSTATTCKHTRRASLANGLALTCVSLQQRGSVCDAFPSLLQFNAALFMCPKPDYDKEQTSMLRMTTKLHAQCFSTP